jgi:hypothetical protein
MEEGFMLVFPKRLLAGDVPNVDYLHLYGPFSLHVLSGWYTLFGYTLESQRTFGLLQHLGIILGVYTLSRVAGRAVAVTAVLTTTLLVLTPIGLSALAWEGAVALAVWSVVGSLRALHTSGRQRTYALSAAGLLTGFALGYRPDLVVALAIVHIWLLRRHLRPWLRPVIIGFAAGMVPLVVHLALAGIGPSIRGMVIDPVFHLRAGRSLPRPPGFGRIDGALQAVAEGPADAPWWRFPALAANHQLFLWFFVVIAIALALPWLTWRRGRRNGWTSPQQVVLMAGSLLGLGMLPQALQRPDSTHLAWGSCVSFALLPLFIADHIHASSRPVFATLRRRPGITSAAVVAAVFFVVCPFYTYRSYLWNTRVAVGNKVSGYEVHRGPRDFWFGNQALQHSSQAAIDMLASVSKPGERLLVGPADLGRTIYSDVVFYYLFPELTPATYFIEMDPGLADQPGSRLASDVASADWVLLTNFWTGWFEPNASINRGSDAPNQVIAEKFCKVGDWENSLVMLYHRCAKGDGVSPALIGVGADRRHDVERELHARHMTATGWSVAQG